MPKKSKTARKSNKKQSKLSSFLSKLNPKTTKAKLVAFILVFGLIGGGYYVYDTYAFTGRHIATIVSSGRYSRSLSINQGNGARQHTINASGGKNQIQAMWVPQNINYYHATPLSISMPPKAETSNPNGWYKACFELFNSRVTNRVNIVVSGAEKQSAIGSSVPRVPPRNNLQTHCTEFNPWKPYPGRPYSNLRDMRFFVRARDANIIVNKVTIIKE